MALDIGTKTIGVAVSDPLGITVRPLTTLRRANLEKDSKAVLELLREQQVQRIVVGRPRHMDGQPSDLLSTIEPLVERLRQRSTADIRWQDERLSTKQADQWMSRAGLSMAERRSRRNAFAAAVILQWHLDEERS
jgi:putative Holliday junction resolvase